MARIKTVCNYDSHSIACELSCDIFGKITPPFQRPDKEIPGIASPPLSILSPSYAFKYTHSRSLKKTYLLENLLGVLGVKLALKALYVLVGRKPIVERTLRRSLVQRFAEPILITNSSVVR